MSHMDSTRIDRVKNSAIIYFWSIKFQKIICVTKENFNKNDCDLCIDYYNGLNNKSPCSIKPNRFGKWKSHIFVCENRFARPLVWPTQSEIPDNLRRDREIGDLSVLEREQIWRLEFESITLINYRSNILDYLSKNKCPCKNHIGWQCNESVNNMQCLFYHLMKLEKTNRKYIIWKADVNEIQDHPTEKQPIAQIDNSFEPTMLSGHSTFSSTKPHSKNQGKKSKQNKSADPYKFTNEDDASLIEYVSFAEFKDEVLSKDRSNSRISSKVNQSTPKRIKNEKLNISIESSNNVSSEAFDKPLQNNLLCSDDNSHKNASQTSVQLNDQVFQLKSRLQYDLQEHVSSMTGAEDVSCERNSKQPVDIDSLLVDEEIDIVFVDKLPPPHKISGKPFVGAIEISNDENNNESLKRKLTSDESCKRLKV